VEGGGRGGGGRRGRGEGVVVGVVVVVVVVVVVMCVGHGGKEGERVKARSVRARVKEGLLKRSGN
jgi:hypothetical protein